jgi:catechol 2,3-dioxygenase-like lactoylglutathione lyase family enzyme
MDPYVTGTTLRSRRHHRGGPRRRDGVLRRAGLQVENRIFVEGEFLDTVIGIPDSRTEIVMLQPPDGGTRLELSSFARPDHLPGSPAAPANELGLRNVSFEVHDLQAAVDQAATDGYRLVGGIGEYEGSWRMAHVRGPEGIIVSLAERIG